MMQYPPSQPLPRPPHKQPNIWLVFVVIAAVLFVGALTAHAISSATIMPPAVATPDLTATFSAYAAATASAQETQQAETPITETQPTQEPTTALEPTTQPTDQPTIIQTEAPTTEPTQQATSAPTPTQPPPTPKPTPTKATCQAVNNNPWCYNFIPGNYIYHPPSNFCAYFNCIASFWNGTGYVNECYDGSYSLSGGHQGDCSHHQGEWRPLYSH